MVPAGGNYRWTINGVYLMITLTLHATSITDLRQQLLQLTAALIAHPENLTAMLQVGKPKAPLVAPKMV